MHTCTGFIIITLWRHYFTDQMRMRRPLSSMPCDVTVSDLILTGVCLGTAEVSLGSRGEGGPFGCAQVQQRQRQCWESSAPTAQLASAPASVSGSRCPNLSSQCWSVQGFPVWRVSSYPGERRRLCALLVLLAEHGQRLGSSWTGGQRPATAQSGSLGFGECEGWFSLLCLELRVEADSTDCLEKLWSQVELFRRLHWVEERIWIPLRASPGLCCW